MKTKWKVSWTTIILAIFAIRYLFAFVSYTAFDNIILVDELNQIYSGLGILFLLVTIISYKVDCIKHKDVRK
jgi:hypothetical protein